MVVGEGYIVVLRRVADCMVRARSIIVMEICRCSCDIEIMVYLVDSVVDFCSLDDWYNMKDSMWSDDKIFASIVVDIEESSSIWEVTNLCDGCCCF